MDKRAAGRHRAADRRRNRCISRKPSDIKKGQEPFTFIEADAFLAYEYAVLLRTRPNEGLTISQRYRDRADCENIFDEIKNQWAWAGFVTEDIKPCRFVSQMRALIYKGWNLFVRIAVPDKHLEAMTTGPL